MGTDAQSKEPIQVEGKLAKQERHTSHILKLRIQYRGRYPRDPEFVLPNWYRDFEIADKTTLEQQTEAATLSGLITESRSIQCGPVRITDTERTGPLV